MSSNQRENRLARETSPYLLQHAKNPVDWYPWGEEALQRAEREDRPILLSIGYAACHWCHVMERESFEDPRIAALMNRDFVCIKVDREERPDLDDVYMAATIALTGAGGWPMTVFLTPEQTPFFAGTYFPPEDRGGRLGFASLLERVAELWQDDRDQLFRQAAELTEHIQRQSRLEPARSIRENTIARAVASLEQSFDSEWGGFGTAPKFPPCQALHLLLRYHQSTGNAHALSMAQKTLDAMKDGGIYDHLGGGFARYSTDREWLAPHFEKMLYDNAQLARVYLEAYQVTANREYQRVVEETLDYVCREMQSPEGGYYSATDADSEGVEGKYFTFTTKELRQILEPEETRVIAAYYGLTESGNWEATNILHVRQSLDDVAKSLNATRDECEAQLQRGRAKLLAARALRVPPLLDDKVLVSWNALMLGTMAEAGRVLGAAKYLRSAERAAEFLWSKLRDDTGALLRTRRGDVAHVRAFLEDYAALSDAFIDLYEAGAGDVWLRRAHELATQLVDDFRDAQSGAFFQTSALHEVLIVRTRDGNDGALPNANALAARALFRLSHHVAQPQFAAHAGSALRAYAQRVESMPRAHLTTLNVLDLMLEPPLEIVFSGTASARAELERAVALTFLPRRVIAYAGDGDEASLLAQGKGSSNAVLYLCRDRVCDKPITSAADVASALGRHMRAAAESRSSSLRPPRSGGLATDSGTRRYFESRKVNSSAIHTLGDSELSVSRVGFGGHRVNEETSEHQEALLLALRSGCNLLDTAPAYGAGSSERAIGNALSELLRTAELERDQVVIVSKLGLFQAAPEAAQQVPGARSLGPNLAYCLEPQWLQEQLEGSLDRLNITALDVCLLHSPELLLATVGSDGTWKALGAAFEWLETQVQQGRIGRYGLSSNALSLETKGEPALTLKALEHAIVEHSAKHFCVLELPLNPLESRPWEEGLIARAQAKGWAVLTQRTLSAVVGDELWRLADANEDPDAPTLDEASDALRHVEAEFRARIGSVLSAASDSGSGQAALDPKELLNWSSRITPRQVTTRALWNDFERAVLAPELTQTLAALDRAFAGKQLGAYWREFRPRYVQQVENTVLAARAHASRNSNRALAPISRKLAAITAMPPKATLSQRVVWAISNLDGVSAALVGMRDTGHVQDALATLTWPALEDAPAALLEPSLVTGLTHDPRS